MDAVIEKVAAKRITNSKDLRKLRAILPDPVARKHFMSRQGDIASAMSRLEPLQKRDKSGLPKRCSNHCARHWSDQGPRQSATLPPLCSYRLLGISAGSIPAPFQHVVRSQSGDRIKWSRSGTVAAEFAGCWI